MMKIRLRFENTETEIELKETPCARKIYEAAPFESIVHLWGEEIYFETPVESALDETAKEIVEKGEAGYWPEGKALCLFFGPTPISSPQEIRPASAVNLIGKIVSSLEELKRVKEGSKVLVEKTS